MNEVLQLMLIWGGLILGGAFVTNALAFGIPWKVLSVRASMGKKIIVHVRTMTGYYYRTGVIDGDFLIYRARNDKRSERRRIDLANAEKLLNTPVLFRAWGVVNVAVDEASNAVIAVDMKAIQPHDAIKVDHLIKRALLAPKIADKKEVIIIVLIIIVLLLCLFLAFKVSSNGKLIAQVASQTANLTVRLPPEAAIISSP